MKKQLHFTFDRRLHCGSPEHFFHFMWGYLLPSVHIINTAQESEKIRYVFSSCGPVMDNLISEVMQMCQYDFEIILNIQNKYKDSQVIVPRWDIALLQPLLIDQDAIVCGKISRMSKKLSDHPILYNDFTQKHFISELSLAISQTKTLIEEKIAASANGRDLSAYTDAYLILSRSLPPSYYVETKYKVGWLRSICAGIFGNKNHVKRGKSERLGYGVSRRGLLGIQAAKKKLLESEIPVEVFEPGQFSLTEQIKVFQSCKGIIAIKVPNLRI